MPGILREELIGGCRLILGDCLEVIDDIERADHIICDPPYEQSLHDAKKKTRSDLRKDGGAELQSLDFDGIDKIRRHVVGFAEKVTGWFIAFCTLEGVSPWAEVINASPIKYKRACVWVKPDSTPQLNGQGPAQAAECFVVAWCGKGHARWNAGGKRNIYTHTVNPRDRTGRHPTEKPWRLFTEILTDFTQPNDLIVDPFMGSGTTLVACAKTGRRGIGIEKNPEYFELACERVREVYAQPDFFVNSGPKPKQEKLSFD